LNAASLHLVRTAATRLREQLLDAQQALASGSGHDDVGPRVREALDQCLDQLATTHCWGPENRTASHELWRIAGPLLQLGSLQAAARAKPRGYAGDYLMLDRICRQLSCDDPLGSLMDRYFLDQAAPRAVRQRVGRLSQRIVKLADDASAAERHVVSVGSGPVAEVEMALQALAGEQRQRLRVTLLDLDPEALGHANKILQPLLPAANLVCVQCNLSRLTQTSTPHSVDAARKVAAADLLYCAGFFDYLEDPSATAMLGLFWRSLAAGGQAIVYNFAPGNASRAYMEWIGNWYLKYRRPEDLRALGLAAGIAAERLAVRNLADDALVEMVASKNVDPAWTA
jgi:extracellular factor (EF) 3-hydroxypalmitic acid methyl ester biosynthesis protein